MAALVMECDEIAGYGSAGYVLFVLGYAGHELVFKIPVFCDHLTVVLLGACNTSCSSDNVSGLTVRHSIWHHAGLHIRHACSYSLIPNGTLFGSRPHTGYGQRQQEIPGH
jgi:hypothetical protein